MLFSSSGCDYLIVGLGNPGRDYERTRHNVGFRAVDLLAESLGVKADRVKFRALVSPIVRIGGYKVLLMKPQTYMNSSGDAVKLAGAFYSCRPSGSSFCPMTSRWPWAASACVRAAPPGATTG